MEQKEFKGYITKCGVKVKMMDGHPWAWRVDGEKDPQSTLKAISSSSSDWYNGNEVIFATCYDCPYKPVYRGKPYNTGDGDEFMCFCELNHTSEYDGAYRQFVGEDHIKYRSWYFQRYLETGTMDCACITEGKAGKSNINYDPGNCEIFQPHGCTAETCFVTKKKREELTAVNIVADIKFKVDADTLFEKEAVEKGIKLKGPLVKEIAERKVQEILKEAAEWSDYWKQHYNKLRGYTPVRVYTVRGSGKDLMQDIQDVNEGLEVIHASDRVKATAQAKRDRKLGRQAAKTRKSEKSNIEKWKIALKGDDKVLREFAERELKKRNIDVVEYEQKFLF